MTELESGASVSPTHISSYAISEESSERDMQISMVSNTADEIYDELKNIDADTLTPIEAMNILYKLINKVKNS